MLQTVTVLLRLQAALTWQLTLGPSCCPAVVIEAAVGDLALPALDALVASVSSNDIVCMKFLLDMVENVALRSYNNVIN